MSMSGSTIKNFRFSFLFFLKKNYSDMSAYNNYVSKTQAKRVLIQRDTTIKQKTALITRQKELELKHLYVDSTYNCAQQLAFHITDKLDSLNNEFPWRLEEYKKLRDSVQHKASELFDIKSIEDMDKHSGIKELTQFGTIDWFASPFFNGEWQLSTILKAFIHNQNDPHFDAIFDYLFHRKSIEQFEEDSNGADSRKRSVSASPTLSNSSKRQRSYDDKNDEEDDL